MTLWADAKRGHCSSHRSGADLRYSRNLTKERIAKAICSDEASSQNTTDSRNRVPRPSPLVGTVTGVTGSVSGVDIMMR
jgi:hypothetical protein